MLNEKTGASLGHLSDSVKPEKNGFGFHWKRFINNLYLFVFTNEIFNSSNNPPKIQPSFKWSFFYYFIYINDYYQDINKNRKLIDWRNLENRKKNSFTNNQFIR